MIDELKEDLDEKIINITGGHDIDNLLEWYARLEKGEQLYTFLKQKGHDYCQFEVELG